MVPLLLVLGLWAPATFGAAQPCSRLDLEATVDPQLHHVAGHIACAAPGPGPSWVTAYPEFLGGPEELTDINFAWLYPAGYAPAQMVLAGAELEAPGPLRGWRSLRRPPPGAPLRIHFSTRIPQRFGALGWAERSVRLLAGWHPSLASEPSLPVRRWHYRIQVPAGVVGLVGHRPVARGAGPRWLEGEHLGRFVPVWLAPAAVVLASPQLVLLAPAPSPRRSEPANLGHSRDGEAQRAVATALSEGARAAREMGLPTPPLMAVVDGLRAHLAEGFDRGLLVSDRAMHLAPGPIGALQKKLQRRALWRAQWAQYVLAATAEGDGARDLEPAVVAEVVADVLLAAYARAHEGEGEDAAALLDRIDVIPEIDNLVFAPQVPMAETYYRVPQAPQPALGPWQDAYARGQSSARLFVKARAAVAPAALEAAARAYLRGQRPWGAVLAVHAGPRAQAALRPWLSGAPPQLDWSVAARPNPRGIEVEVQATGPDLAAAASEPVDVLAVDAAGAEHRRRRWGPGTLIFDAPAPARRLTLDPNNSLLEAWHPAGQNAQFNNHVPKRWRLLLNDITGLVAVTNRQLSLSADFSLRRLFELRRRLGLTVGFGPGLVGGTAGITWGFGRELTALRLAHGLSLALSSQHLLAERNIPSGGWIGALSLSYLYDTRLSPYSSFRGAGVNAYVTAATSSAGGRLQPFAQAGLGALKLWPLSLRSALLARLRADWSTAATPPQYALRLGARYRGLRGYESNEARGDRRLLMSLELRQTLTSASRDDLGGWLTLTRLEAALFADGALLHHREPGCPRQAFADVGAGLRFLWDVLQVSPSVLAVDVGVPLSRCPGLGKNLPIVVWLAFLQSFSTF